MISFLGRLSLVPIILFLLVVGGRAASRGADLPWTTLEAEDMETSGTVLGPKYDPFLVETESSHQRCVRLAAGEFVEFSAPAEANALVVRFSLPDAEKGGGTATQLDLEINGHRVRSLYLTSHYSHLYGVYPFSNDPAQGKPRNFYDEIRIKGVTIARGDKVTLKKGTGEATTCILDLVDLENVPPPLSVPAKAISIRDVGAKGNGESDDTEALKKAIGQAAKEGRPVWVPAGDYKITGDLVLPSNVTIQGAGMWHTTFVGDERLYGDAARRVRFKLAGKNIHLADFAILGRLNYRNDSEPNDGIVGSVCADSSIERIWVEHTKVGAWIYNGTDLRIVGCRFRNLLADGVNLCVGTSGTVIENCSTRGTGDDCFAIWPVPTDQGFVEGRKPGGNVIRHCTGQLPFLANGGSLYGGDGNRIEDCLFTDITPGCGILISTTFPTSDDARKIDNNFSGTTVVKDCSLIRCGGYDHSWTWRGAFQICMDRRNISGLAISGVEIRDSFSDGLTVVGPGSAKGQGTLSAARVENLTVQGVGLGRPGSHEILIRADARGGLTLVNSRVDDIRNDSPEFVLAK
ncbi:MAG TPA: glycosyl hydrolase family 28-related protein [Candidatus Didemnitutus sp.]|nr:glycosyl hydrolase family 28-related protein [Candidatus Didemnitutus sp.]